MSGVAGDGVYGGIPPLPGYHAYRSGVWIGERHPAAGATTTLAADTIYAVPFPIRYPVRVDTIGLNVAAAVVGNARLGLYNNISNSVVAPGSLIAEADAAIDTNSIAYATAGFAGLPLLKPPLVWAVILPNAAAQVTAYAANATDPSFASLIIGGNASNYIVATTATGRALRATVAAAYSGGLPASFGTATFGASGSGPMFTLRTV